MRPSATTSIGTGVSLFAISLLTLASVGTAQQTLTTNVMLEPSDAKFDFSDIENFIEAQDTIASGADPAEALQARYLDRASPGLLMFIEKYDLTLDRLLAAMEKYPEAYERLPAVLAALHDQEHRYRETLADVRRAIPDAVFPPTYFVVSHHWGINSGSIEGPLLSVEKNTAESIRGGDIESTLVHEMVHIQQLAATGEEYFAIFSGEERTLLALSIREGASTYFSEIISGGSEHKNQARDYYLAHEAELWEAFRADMLGLDMGEWLWEDPSDPDMPRDLGYAIGARIVEAFYESADDKGAAAQTVMSITDYPGFLTHSGYSPR